jgi:hypothetical protein
MMTWQALQNLSWVAIQMLIGDRIHVISNMKIPVDRHPGLSRKFTKRKEANQKRNQTSYAKMILAIEKALVPGRALPLRRP